MADDHYAVYVVESSLVAEAGTDEVTSPDRGLVDRDAQNSAAVVVDA